MEGQERPHHGRIQWLPSAQGHHFKKLCTHVSLILYCSLVPAVLEGCKEGVAGASAGARGKAGKC
jgi:hypothetical protein